MVVLQIFRSPLYKSIKHKVLELCNMIPVIFDMLNHNITANLCCTLYTQIQLPLTPSLLWGVCQGAGDSAHSSKIMSSDINREMLIKDFSFLSIVITHSFTSLLNCTERDLFFWCQKMMWGSLWAISPEVVALNFIVGPSVHRTNCHSGCSMAWPKLQLCMKFWF